MKSQFNIIEILELETDEGTSSATSLNEDADADECTDEGADEGTDTGADEGTNKPKHPKPRFSYNA